MLILHTCTYVTFFVLYYRVNHGLAPGRKRAYMLYKAALKDTSSTNSSVELADEADRPDSTTIAPHPYFMALGVLSIQKVILLLCNW